MNSPHLLLIFLFAPSFTFAQADTLWLPLKPLIGNWAGTGEAPEGKGTYERSYQFVLNNKFIEVKNRSIYPPTKAGAKEYVHDDHGYISYDKSRKTFVLRQFHGEGFVNQYILESISPDRKKIVFVTESIENIPKGFRARETYTLDGDSFTEEFNLAEPGKNFEPYSTVTFKRSK